MKNGSRDRILYCLHIARAALRRSVPRPRPASRQKADGNWAGPGNEATHHSESGAMATAALLEKKYVKAKIASLKASLQLAENATEKHDEIVRHIKAVENDPVFQLDPEFPSGLEWFNSGPLSFQRELKGKIVVLDFFTYCCINCMHILPDLAKLEERYSDKEGVVVVGVHSAKFNNEKVSDNIQNAIMRYGISHPVVNDKEIVLWERLGVICWPTLVIIGPNCQLLHCIIGEGHFDELMSFMDAAVQYYKDGGKLNSDSIGIFPAGASLGASVLKFPGKICTDVTGAWLFVSDSAHNQILEVDRKTGDLIEQCREGRRSEGWFV